MSAVAASAAAPAAAEAGGDEVPPGRRERTKAANRAAILAAAREVFAELGFGAASVRDIVRRTELATGTFYNYFPDKDEVFRALLEESARDVRARLVAARASAATLERFVLDGFRAYFAAIAEDPTMTALFRRNAGTIRTMFDDPVLGAGVDELLVDLRAAVERGDLPPIDVEYAAAAMAGAGLEIGLRMVERDPVDVEAAARFAADLFLGGIARLAG